MAIQGLRAIGKFSHFLVIISGVAILSGSASGQAPSCRQPDYPPEAQPLRRDATGVYSFLIGIDGKVQDSKVMSSTGSAVLDKAAIDAFSQCIFHPATTDGNPTVAWANVKWTWKLPTEIPMIDIPKSAKTVDTVTH